MHKTENGGIWNNQKASKWEYSIFHVVKRRELSNIPDYTAERTCEDVSDSSSTCDSKVPTSNSKHTAYFVNNVHIVITLPLFLSSAFVISLSLSF